MTPEMMYRTLAETVKDSNNPHYETPRIRVHMESGDASINR